MVNRTDNSIKNPDREGWLLLGIAAFILIMFFLKLFNVLLPELQKTDMALREHHAIKLEPGMDKAVLKTIIADGNYYGDSRDVELLADSLCQKLFTTGPLDNLGALNKNAFAVLAPLPWHTNMGGTDFQERLIASRQRLGFDSALYVQELMHPGNYPSVQQAGTMQKPGAYSTMIIPCRLYWCS